MGRSTVHYADNKTNNALKALHNKLRPAGTPVQRVEYIIELLLLRIFETKIKQDDEFKPLWELFSTVYKWLNQKQEKKNQTKTVCFPIYRPFQTTRFYENSTKISFFSIQPFYKVLERFSKAIYRKRYKTISFD